MVLKYLSISFFMLAGFEVPDPPVAPGSLRLAPA
jgi:hypothetical protein